MFCIEVSVEGQSINYEDWIIKILDYTQQDAYYNVAVFSVEIFCNIGTLYRLSIIYMFLNMM